LPHCARSLEYSAHQERSHDAGGSRPFGRSGYDIHIGRGLLDQAGSLIGPILQRAKVAIVTDSNVAPLHLRRLTEALQGAGIAHGPWFCPQARRRKAGHI